MKNFLLFTVCLSRLTIVIIITVIAGVSFLTGRLTKQTISTSLPQASIKILARQTINKTFSFPVSDASGNVATNAAYTVLSADIQNDIFLKGDVASAVAGKTFLILTIKVANSSDKDITLNTRDYIRLSEGYSPDLLAADVHNDPVSIQPISTKYTRIGFTIDTKQKRLVLHIGEIDGEKTTVILHIHS